MISLDVYPDSPPSLSFNKIKQFEDFVRCLSRFPSLSLWIKLNQFDDFVRSLLRFPYLSLWIKSTNLIISLDIDPGSTLSLF